MERSEGRLLAIVERQVIEQQPDLFQRFDIVFISAVGDGGFLRVGAGAAQLFGGDDLVGDGLDHVRAGDEHVGAVAHHEDEVGHGRRIDGTAGAGAHDDGNLRHDAGRLDVALEDLGVTGERIHTLLDAGAAGIVEADHRSAVAQRHIHDLAYLLRMRLGE